MTKLRFDSSGRRQLLMHQLGGCFAAAPRLEKASLASGTRLWFLAILAPTVLLLLRLHGL